MGGDYNNSETFDAEWHDQHRVRFGLCLGGNREVLDRMLDLGFSECLRGFNKAIVPTFQNSTDKKVVHQMDHLFVTNDLYSKLKNCVTGDQTIIFGNF